jgi:hypothetical protein
MDVVPAVAFEVGASGAGQGRLFGMPEPGVVGLFAVGLLSAVLVPFDVGLEAQDTGALSLYMVCIHEWTDIETHAIVEVRMPAEGLLLKWLPADQDVVRGLALQDLDQLGLQGLGGAEALGGAGLVGLGVGVLLADPIAEVAVGELLERGVVESVIVYEGMETVSTSVPKVPDKGAVLEKLAVLPEEGVPQPVLQVGLPGPGRGQ